jgi:hypothetical protein
MTTLEMDLTYCKATEMYRNFAAEVTTTHTPTHFFPRSFLSTSWATLDAAGDFCEPTIRAQVTNETPPTTLFAVRMITTRLLKRAAGNTDTIT